jgi:hypothetical protein
MTVQSAALRALWQRGAVVAVLVVAALMTAASTRPVVVAKATAAR